MTADKITIISAKGLVEGPLLSHYLVEPIQCLSIHALPVMTDYALRHRCREDHSRKRHPPFSETPFRRHYSRYGTARIKACSALKPSGYSACSYFVFTTGNGQQDGTSWGQRYNEDRYAV